MTEEIAATPSWVEQRLDDVFAGLPDGALAARTGYLACLGRQKAPAAPSDLLGAEFEGCRATLRRGLAGLHLPEATLAALDQKLEALEAEIAESS